MFVFNQQIERLSSIKRNIAEQFKPMKGSNQYTSAIIQHENKILLLKRTSTDKFQPNTWCMAGGTIEDGEVLVDSMLREVTEETGLRANQLNVNNTFKTTEGGNTIYYFICHVGYDEYTQESVDVSYITLDESEHSQYIWVSIDDLLRDDCEYELMLDTKKHLKILRESAII